MIAKPYIDPARWAAVRLFAMDVDGIAANGTTEPLMRAGEWA